MKQPLLNQSGTTKPRLVYLLIPVLCLLIVLYYGSSSTHSNLQEKTVGLVPAAGYKNAKRSPSSGEFMKCVASTKRYLHFKLPTGSGLAEKLLYPSCYETGSTKNFEAALWSTAIWQSYPNFPRLANGLYTSVFFSNKPQVNFYPAITERMLDTVDYLAFERSDPGWLRFASRAPMCTYQASVSFSSNIELSDMFDAIFGFVETQSALDIGWFQIVPREANDNINKGKADVEFGIKVRKGHEPEEALTFMAKTLCDYWQPYFAKQQISIALPPMQYVGFCGFVSFASFNQELMPFGLVLSHAFDVKPFETIQLVEEYTFPEEYKPCMGYKTEYHRLNDLPKKEQKAMHGYKVPADVRKSCLQMQLDAWERCGNPLPTSWSMKEPINSPDPRDFMSKCIGPVISQFRPGSGSERH